MVLRRLSSAPAGCEVEMVVDGGCKCKGELVERLTDIKLTVRAGGRAESGSALLGWTC